MDDSAQTLDELLARYNAPASSTSGAPAYLWPDTAMERRYQGAQAMRTDARMAPWEPKYVTDNLSPMISDAARAVGVPDRVADRLGREGSTAASFTPPGAAVDAAGDIGSALGRGNSRDAIIKAALWNAFRLFGLGGVKAAAGVLPTEARRDAWRATAAERQPGAEAISDLGVSRHAPGVTRDMGMTDARATLLPWTVPGNKDQYVMETRRGNMFTMPRPSNVNDRSDMRSRLWQVE